MSDKRIYIESKVLGLNLISRIVHTPFVLSLDNSPPIIYDDNRTGLYETCRLSYSNFPDGAKIFDAMIACWCDLSDTGKSTIKWGSKANSFASHFTSIGKISLQANRFFYWEDDDPGSTIELCQPIMTFRCTPDMRMMNHLEITVSGYTKEAHCMHPSLECMWNATKTKEQLKAAGWRPI